MIILINGRGQEREFDFEHAVRVLTLGDFKQIGSWHLPHDSPYIYQHGNIITHPGNGTGKGAQVPAADS